MSGYPNLDYVSMNVCDFLQGKDKPSYTPWKEDGDIVVVTNAEHVVLTGKKWDQKEYTWTTGYPGLRKENARTRFDREPETILIEAVRRMLPKNKLAYKMLDRLKVYTGDKHPHQAQQPKALEL